MFKGLLKKDNRVVAMKAIDTEGISSDQVLNIKGEIDTIRTLAHDHIVCYLGTLKINRPSKILIFWSMQTGAVYGNSISARVLCLSPRRQTARGNFWQGWNISTLTVSHIGT